MDNAIDFVAWADEQAAILRRLHTSRMNDLMGLDAERLAEEVQDLGDLRREDLEAALSRILEHLLKLELSPAADPRRGWTLSVVEHRNRANRFLRRSGTLRREAPGMLADAWADARRLAVRGLAFDGIAGDAVPADCPWTLAQILDDDFEPANRHGLS